MSAVVAPTPPSPDPRHLPVVLRARVLALAAQVLPDVTPLPPALRKVAAFTPQRRARLGGAAIERALTSDDGFRALVATQVAASSPHATEVLEGDGPDEVEVGALTWLLRPEGWQDRVGVLVERLGRRAEAAAEDRESVDLELLRRKLEGAEATARELRAAHRQVVEELKAENAALRRKLGESRAAERTAREKAAAASTEVAGASARVDSVVSAADAENRRLRRRIEELEGALAAARRASRDEQEGATLRARVLLDTLLESAHGLRRELGLPTVSGSPAERLEAELEADGDRSPAALPVAPAPTPAVLEQLLAMPRARLIVDGYNVSKTAWPGSSLDAQRARLLKALAPVVARGGAETTVVFDAASSTSRPPATAPRGVKVLFSPVGVIADDVIRDLVAVEPGGRVVVVVSSDREVARDATRGGARAVSSEVLVELLTRQL
ncbi:NYN domain-containing protein [Nocardioides pacificus]